VKRNLHAGRLGSGGLSLNVFTDAELEDLNLPTAQPIVYDMAPDGAALPRGGRYLDPDTAVLAAIRIMFEGGT